MVEGSYICGTSAVPLLGMTISEMVDSIAAKYPDTEAIVSVHQNIRWTYREFAEQVNQVARALMGLGVEKGDRVGIWAMNHAEWVVVQFATSKIGAIMVNINPAYRTYELEYVLKQAEISTLIVQGRFKTSDYVGMFYEACPEAYECKPGRISSEKFPFLKNAVFMGDIPYNGMYTWGDFLKKADEITMDDIVERGEGLSFDDPINIQYTSGTTGFPKGVVLTHHNVLNNGFIIGEGMGFTEKDRLCIPVPFYHCFGMVLSNLACVTHGSTMVLPAPTFDAEEVLKTIEKEHCTAVHGVPTMFIAELTHPNFCKVQPPVPADRYHGRFPLPDRGDEAGQHADAHERDRDRVRPDRDEPRRHDDDNQGPGRAPGHHDRPGIPAHRTQDHRPQDRQDRPVSARSARSAPAVTAS